MSSILMVDCYGYGKDGQKIFTKPIEVKIKIYIKQIHIDPKYDSIYVNPINCSYSNTCGTGYRCMASHPHNDPYIEKGDEVVFCPYVFDYPYAKFNNWKIPEQIKEAIKLFRLLSIGL